VGRRVAVLHAPVVAAAEQGAGGIEQRAADRDPALLEARARLGDGDGEHGAAVDHRRAPAARRMRAIS
jgi:hypothetical protein